MIKFLRVHKYIPLVWRGLTQQALQFLSILAPFTRVFSRMYAPHPIWKLLHLCTYAQVHFLDDVNVRVRMHCTLVAPPGGGWLEKWPQISFFSFFRTSLSLKGVWVLFG